MFVMFDTHTRVQSYLVVDACIVDGLLTLTVLDCGNRIRWQRPWKEWEWIRLCREKIDKGKRHVPFDGGKADNAVYAPRYIYCNTCGDRVALRSVHICNEAREMTAIDYSGGNTRMGY